MIKFDLEEFLITDIQNSENSSELEKKIHLLIVEDEPDIAFLLQRFSSKYVDLVSLASHGQEALELIQGQHFDLIFSDMNMPVMDGKEFIVKLRKSGDQTPFIFISAYSHLKEDLLRSDLKVFDFIVKPFNKGNIEKIFIDFHTYLKRNK